MWTKENAPKNGIWFTSLQLATFGEPLHLAETGKLQWRHGETCEQWACSRYCHCSIITPPTFLIQWAPFTPESQGLQLCS